MLRSHANKAYLNLNFEFERQTDRQRDGQVSIYRFSPIRICVYDITILVIVYK